MKIAFTHNLRLTDSEEEAEFDSAETVEGIAAALTAAGHEVEKIEVSGPASHLVSRLEASDPDLIFNTAEASARRGRGPSYPGSSGGLASPSTAPARSCLTLPLANWLTNWVLKDTGV